MEDSIKDEELAYRALKVRLMLETGWTHDYIDSLPMTVIGDISAYWNGQAKGEKKLAKISR